MTKIEIYIDKLRRGFPEYRFEIKKQTKEFSMILVYYDDTILGRLNFKDGEFTHHKVYKPYKDGYEPNDAFFYLYSYYLETGKSIDLDGLIPIAKRLKNEKVSAIMKWREENPKYDRHGKLRVRAKISSDWMWFFRELVSEQICYGKNILEEKI